MIGVIGVAHGMSHFFQLVLPPLFPLLRAEFDVSYATLGALVSTFYVASALCQFGAGFALVVLPSWISTGANQPISADQISKVFGGSGVLGQLAAKAGMSPQDLTQKLSQVLPAAIDKLTPGGTIPSKGA